MENNSQEIVLSQETEDHPSTNAPSSELGSTLTLLTVRDYDKEVQDLKRENFNLKLRIYFLEEQNQVAGSHEYATRTTYVHQLENELEQLRRRLCSQSTQSDVVPQTVYNFGYDDERRAFREELEKYRKDNEQLRQMLHRYKAQADNRLGQSTLTMATSVDSALDKTPSGMSSTFFNSNSLQVELDESKERERKLQEQVYSLRQQLDSSKPKLNDLNKTIAELDHARRQIQQFEIEIQNYQQQQSKAERVLQRLQSEYDAQISRLVEQQQNQTADYEKYRQESLIARIRLSYPTHDQMSANVNIDEYQQALNNRDRIIEQLEEAIAEITTRLRTPFTLMLSSTVTSTGWQDEKSQNLIQELNTQMQSHLETIEQLRAECIELRQGEKHLRNQIDGLTHLINTPVRNPELPPLPRPSSSTPKAIDNIEDAQQLEALQTAIVQITLQLRSDAENVSGLTNRVAQILRDRDEWQYKINRLQDELEQKTTRILQLEKREREYENQGHQQYSVQIETLQREIKTLQDQLRDRERSMNEIRMEKETLRSQSRKDYEKFDNIHNQEKQNLQGQLRELENARNDLKRELENERRRFDDLQRKYEKITSTSETQVEQMEQEIQKQRRQIETFNVQIREMENTFLTERRQLERERDFEKNKSIEIQNTLNTTNRRYSELQADFDRIKEHSGDELQTLRRENQSLQESLRVSENKLHDLTRRNEDFKSQVSVYEHRFQDTEDSDRRHRNENARLQNELQEITRENENLTREINETRRRYETVKLNFSDTQTTIEKIGIENKNIQHENTQLKREIDELSVQIRIQIQTEYEEELRQLSARTESQIQNTEKDKRAILFDLEQSNIEKQRLTDRLQSVEYNLKQANQTIADYENDIKRLKQAINTSQERTEQIEREISRAYTTELKSKTNRLQDFENKYRALESQLSQYEITIQDLRAEKAKQIECNDRLQHDFDQYRYEQQKHIDDVAKKNSTLYEEHIRREVLAAIENKQELIAELESQLRERDNQIKKLQQELASYEPKDLRFELEIRIEQLEEEIHRQERSIQNFDQTVRDKERQIEKLRDKIQESENSTTNTIETLQIEIQKRDRQIEKIANDKKYDVSGFERQINELQVVIRDREREIVDINDKLRQIEREYDTQQRELKDCRQKLDNSNIKLNVAIEQNEAHLERIKHLEKKLEGTSNRTQTSEQTLHLQTVIEDLKAQLRQREDSLKGLQRTIADCDSELKETRHIYDTLHSEHSRMQLRYEQMDKQYKAELTARDQTIDSLQTKLARKEQDSKYSTIGALVPTDQSWKLEIQKRDEVIDELKRKLDQANKSRSPVGQTKSSNYEYARRIEIRPRLDSKNFSQLNREELQYELDMALQQNEELIKQLALVIRKELARQKYVNQVLWRKLDALSDIYGSNTRAELADELVNYQPELEALKSKQYGSSTVYVSAPNLNLRDSSSKRQFRDYEEESQHKALITKKSNEEIVCSEYKRKLEELQNIIRQQNQHIQQLQTRVQISTPDILQSSTLEKLTEENKKLHLVSDTYKAETEALKCELNKNYSTIEYSRGALKQYENVIKDQQKYIDQINYRLQQREQSSTKQSFLSSEQVFNKLEDLIINLDIDILPIDDNPTKTSINKKETAAVSTIDSARYTSMKNDYQQLINEKDDEIRQLQKQLSDLRKAHENEMNQYQRKYERIQIESQNGKQNEQLKATQQQLEQAQDQNQRLRNEIKSLQHELSSQKELIAHYDKQISLLEKQISSRDNGKGEMTVRTNEMSGLLEEMRHLRQDLEGSINRQNELQIKLDENIRLTKAPREFTFSGRGVSYPDLRVIDASASVSSAENYFITSMTEEKRSRPLGSSTIEFETERTGSLDKLYAIGELENHENLRRLIVEIRNQLKAVESQLQERARSKTISSIADPSVQWLEQRLQALNQCVTLLERIYQLVETYRTTQLPAKTNSDERLVAENKELRQSLSKCSQDLQSLKQKYKDQTVHLEQVLGQLTVSLPPSFDCIQDMYERFFWHPFRSGYFI
ncbi:unnamed protein product [Adineta ricciae]|uniref:Centrosomin N-terminal motif 1 domain-containing protein n=1 Tax=Adineta ricciae TaxID=249248 RepID=A0A814MYG7_ADIRI|nr:unnamed protein product [Adineta ricciae]